MFVVHWFNTELWAPMWPNVFAPSAITLVAIVLSHLKLKEHQRKQHAEHMEALAKLAPKPDSQ